MNQLLNITSSIWHVNKSNGMMMKGKDKEIRIEKQNEQKKNPNFRAKALITIGVKHKI